MEANGEAEKGNRREFPRQRSGAECICVLAGRESRVVLVDVSCGGAKLRFEAADAAMAALLPVPRDIVISDEHSVMPATVMWAGGGLAGCRFHQHLSLDEVGRMMNGHFRLEVPQPSEQAFEAKAAPQAEERVATPAEPDGAADAEARLEAEMEARIKAMIEADMEAEPTPPS